MLVGIIGTRYSGKTTTEDYLVNHHGFTRVRLVQEVVHHGVEPDRKIGVADVGTPVLDLESDLAVTTHTTDPHQISHVQSPLEPITFSSPTALLSHVTRHWRSHFVTRSLPTKALLQPFLKRPFFMLLSVDAPVMMRFRRCKMATNGALSLEEFVTDHDELLYGTPALSNATNVDSPSETSIRALQALTPIHLPVVNLFSTTTAFHEHLDSLNILDPDRLRPNWDTYFMTLASLASRRSNCMKRRVGAILVRNNRIVSTGYNGTPRGLKNCNDGGCRVCNAVFPPNESFDECLCLHAEENALLEAGRERVGDGGILYCDTCPCLRCTVKIVQTGVKEVVYNLSYKVDDASAQVFAEAGVKLRRHAPVLTA